MTTRKMQVRFLFGIAVIILILVVPVIPRDKVIYVSGQTTTTQTFQSTSLQTLQTTTQNNIQVYVGSILYVQAEYYLYWKAYYDTCVRLYNGAISCAYSHMVNWPAYTTSITVNRSDNFVSKQDTQTGDGLSTLTLTRYDGSVVTYANVVNDSLTLSGTSMVQSSRTQTTTVTQTVSTVMNVPCDKCIPQHVTEYISLVQLLLQR